MNMDFNLYMNDILRTARSEMEASGYEQLTTPEQVEDAFKRSGTTLVMVNSVAVVRAVSHVRQPHMQSITINARIILSLYSQGKTKKRQRKRACFSEKIICHLHRLSSF